MAKPMRKGAEEARRRYGSADSALHADERVHGGATGIPAAVPAAELRDDPGRHGARCDARTGADVPEDGGEEARVRHQLCQRIASVHSAGPRDHHQFRALRGTGVSPAGDAVRELPRSPDRSGDAAHGDHGSPGVPVPRRRDDQYLHGSRVDHPHRIDHQAGHSDRAIRQRDPGNRRPGPPRRGREGL